MRTTDKQEAYSWEYIYEPDLEDYQVGRECELQGTWREIKPSPSESDYGIWIGEPWMGTFLRGSLLHDLRCPVRYRPDPIPEVELSKPVDWEFDGKKFRFDGSKFWEWLGTGWTDRLDGQAMVPAIKQLLAERSELKEENAELQRDRAGWKQAARDAQTKADRCPGCRKQADCESGVLCVWEVDGVSYRATTDHVEMWQTQNGRWYRLVSNAR